MSTCTSLTASNDHDWLMTTKSVSSFSEKRHRRVRKQQNLQHANRNSDNIKPNNYNILLWYNNIYYKTQFIIYKLKKK